MRYSVCIETLSGNIERLALTLGLRRAEQIAGIVRRERIDAKRVLIYDTYVNELVEEWERV